MPNTVIGLIEELEAHYTARCIGPTEELNAHLRYAGKVELVARLRARFEAVNKREAKELPNVLR